jgi:hypothetical protein
MAILDSAFGFTGPLGNLSAYKMRGSDKIILRRKGGASADKIKNDPVFENTRRGNSEFSGRSAATKWLRWALFDHIHVADYRFMGTLNGLLKPIQEMDTASAWGTRNVYLSKNPQLLEGFTLNQRDVLESFVRAPLSCTLSRDEVRGSVSIPDLYAGINFFCRLPHPYFRITASLGMVPDLQYTENGYIPMATGLPVKPETISTEWFAVGEPFESTTLEVYCDQAVPEHVTLILTVGIHFGAPSAMGKLQPVRAGAARLMMLA